METDNEVEQELIKTLKGCARSENNVSYTTYELQENIFQVHNQYTNEEIEEMFGTWAVSYFRNTIARLDKYN